MNKKLFLRKIKEEQKIREVFLKRFFSSTDLKSYLKMKWDRKNGEFVFSISRFCPFVIRFSPIFDAITTDAATINTRHQR